MNAEEDECFERRGGLLNAECQRIAESRHGQEDAMPWYFQTEWNKEIEFEFQT
jgi:hypothetical protein